MAGIDTSIYNQLLRPPKSVADFDAEALVTQQNRLALQSQQEVFADKARAIADGNKLRQVVSGFGTDVAANKQALISAGRLDDALKYEKSNVDAEKTRADISHLSAQSGELTQKTSTAKYELERKKHDVAISEITSFRNPADAIASLERHIQTGEMSPEEGAQVKANIPTDPVQFRQWQMQGVQSILSAKDRMEYLAPTANTVANNNTSIATNAATNATSRANTASNNAVQIRGQNMVDSRTREAASAGKIPAGYRANADGSLSFIPGGPADPAAGGGKPATEFQGKSAGFGARAEESDRIIRDLAKNGTTRPGIIKTTADSIPLVGGALGGVVNALPGFAGGPSEQQQQAEQAQRDFVNAILRQESGAAIGASEFDNAKKQYFPQPGDGAKVIAQKEANRKLAVQGLKNSAGKAAFSAPPVAAPNDVFAAADAILGGGKK